jgi:hypothetical protein
MFWFYYYFVQYDMKEMTGFRRRRRYRRRRRRKNKRHQNHILRHLLEDIKYNNNDKTGER